jgi:hypothetical protein
MSNTTYQIFMLLISLIGVLLTGLVVPWLKLKIGNEKMKDIEKWVTVAVTAAEQMKVAGLLPDGQQKKDYVLEFVKDKGITITDQELDALIEAAVYELNRAKFLMFEDMENQDVEPG